MLVFWVLNMFGRLRISKEGELEGLDLHEHGSPAYPEYVISALAAPRGSGKDIVGHLARPMVLKNPTGNWSVPRNKGPFTLTHL